MYIDDIKLLAKNDKQLETLIQAVGICSEDIRMEFVIGKCAILIMKTGKRQMTEGIELPSQEKNHKAWRKGNLQIFGNVGSGYHQTRKKLKKNIPEERENYCMVEISSKGSPPRKILGTILKVDKERTLINRPKNKKTHADA